MNAVLRGTATWVWLLLLAITLGSWAIGSHLFDAERGGAIALAAVLALSLVKMHLVIRHFMEVQRAPALIRHLSSVWLLVLFSTLLWIYS